MNTPDKCPHCGNPAVAGNTFWTEYDCGTLVKAKGLNSQSEYCKLSVELAATKRELKEYRKERQEFIDRDNEMKMSAQDDAAKLRKAESRVRELEREVTEALELALDQFGAERLSGNIVKEEYWKGELAAIRRMKQAIGEAMPGGASVVHGKTCLKATHIGTGHLHAEDDDKPYDVDGVSYCGRCHTAMPGGGK